MSGSVAGGAVLGRKGSHNPPTARLHGQWAIPLAKDARAREARIAAVLCGCVCMETYTTSVRRCSDEKTNSCWSRGFACLTAASCALGGKVCADSRCCAGVSMYRWKGNGEESDRMSQRVCVCMCSSHPTAAGTLGTQLTETGRRVRGHESPRVDATGPGEDERLANKSCLENKCILSRCGEGHANRQRSRLKRTPFGGLWVFCDLCSMNTPTHMD